MADNFSCRSGVAELAAEARLAFTLSTGVQGCVGASLLCGHDGLTFLELALTCLLLSAGPVHPHCNRSNPRPPLPPWRRAVPWQH
jgi:hypothetical protein